MALETGQPGGIYLSKLGDRIILKKGEEKSISTPQGEPYRKFLFNEFTVIRL